MAFLNSFDISGYGLSAQRFRTNIISSNIANANTTRTAEGGPYRRREVVFKALNFEKHLNSVLKNNLGVSEYEDPLDEDINFADKLNDPTISSVVVDKVVRDDSKPRLKYDPMHPDANKEGYVAYPNINPVVEMADMIEASRAYQANVSSFQTVKAMANSAIDLLKV